MNKTYKTPQEELGMTDQEIRAEVIAQGLDPEDEVEGMRAMARNLRATIPRAAPQPHLSELVHKRFAFFEETVAAGVAAPASFEGDHEASLATVLDQANPKSCIWVRVQGQSMKDASIADRDVVLVDTKRLPKDGDIVVAHVAPHGQVVKRLRLLGDGTALLCSENEAYAPIVIKNPELLEIRGVVIARAGHV
jgi:DNA polymerase V